MDKEAGDERIPGEDSGGDRRLRGCNAGRQGRPSEEILSLSEEIIAGLIVVGNQGLGRRFSRMKRFLMGSVSEKVSRYARCSVMVVRRDLYDRPSA